MELLIFSDSHGRSLQMYDALCRQIKRPDAICFLGDGLRDTEVLDGEGIPLHTVRGNCDWSSFFGDEKSERFLFLEGHKLLLTHGHLHDVKSGLGRLAAYAAQNGVDIVLYGHTHRADTLCVPKGQEIGGVTLQSPLYLFNPGSIGAGADASFGTLMLSGDNVLFSHGSI